MKKITKGLITVLLSTTLLVACSNDEKTTTTTQEKSSQSQQKEQQSVPQEVLKQTKNLKQVGGESVVSKEVERNSSSGVAARAGYVYYMYSDKKQTFVSIADTKKDKWVIKDKVISQTDSVPYGTAFFAEDKMFFIDEKGEIKKQVQLPKVSTHLMSSEDTGYVRTSKGDAAFLTTKDMFKLYYEDGTEKEFPMTDYFSIKSRNDFIDVDKNIVYLNEGTDFTMYDLKKGKWVYDENGKQVKYGKTLSDIVIPFQDYMIRINGGNGKDRFVYLDEKLKPKTVSGQQIPGQEFTVGDSHGQFLVEKDKLISVRSFKFEGEESVQYFEYKKAK
ncbi:hypothetical protein bcgnr5378_62290 [Bacillus cereus]|uniref:Uncharacterized protein n=2 Tax=Bacillus cereus TaxID=1396 RepID=A0A150AYQ4_BACCE|nr:MULTISPECIES: hypothetical protein [Bacillus]KAB7632526.1 hypothetical protein GBN96_25640 [Bacillus sp. B4-WWTP-NA-D-NA-NA]KXI53446.1 hypothetical protein ACS45_07570 [Bacillus cereus]KXX90068.1 hypothetical protein AT274_01545 [Bacillus cereus]MCC2341777.1 hypothetical protein [Bacillus tropicus]MCC2495077.1 hypothetical protein [Bacillus cereus]